ncbi:MAG TPA: sugar transferase [Candidatus Saccharimonadales bacterium]|nr:sugar transferase [Candidatus Saccharimonadales bacterium]
MKNNASLVYNACLIVGDFLALVLAFAVAYLIRAHLYTAKVAHPIHGRTYLEIFLTLLPFWIIIFALLGLYNQSIYEKRFNELGRLLMGSFLGMLFVIFWNFVSVQPIFPAKLVPIYGFVLSFIFLVIFRNIARFVRTKLFTYNIGLNNVLIVGNTSMANELVGSLFQSPKSGYKVLGVVGGQEAIGEHRQVRLFHNFAEALKDIKDPIYTIVQTELYADETRNREILEYAQTHHVAYRFVPGNTELFVGNIDVELFRNSIPVIAVHQTALIGWGRIVKRVFDLLVGGILLVIASPFILLIILAELFSGGQVFFRQTRLTRFNNEFRVFKFRTLKKAYNNLSPEDGFMKMGRPELIDEYRRNGDQIPHDPRFSQLGNFLRRTSLDELPQLINIVRGDISLVGPRPLVPKELSLYEKRHTILSVKSGLTGLAQVSGRKSISFEERRKLDLYYVQNWTFWLDLIILTKTIRVILQGS